LAKAKSDAKAIRADQGFSKKQRRTQLEAIRANTEQQLQTALTPEQFQKFQELKAEHKPAHRKGGNSPVPAA
jgi:Spy/CpxP family protein refolding chaperone